MDGAVSAALDYFFHPPRAAAAAAAVGSLAGLPMHEASRASATATTTATMHSSVHSLVECCMLNHFVISPNITPSLGHGKMLNALRKTLRRNLKGPFK